jgi:hypothetical protein
MNGCDSGTSGSVLISVTLRMRDRRVVQVDAHGNKQVHKPQYKVEGGKVYETDA